MSTRNNSSANNNRDYQFGIDNTDKVFFAYSTTGSDWNFVGGPTAVASTAPIWLRVTRLANNGSGSSVITFFTSTDGTNWTTNYSTTQGAVGATYSSSSPLTLGSEGLGYYSSMLNGKMYFVSTSNTIAGTTSASTCSTTGVFNCFNPNDYVSGATFTSSSSQAETWTVNRSGTNLPADIASDLAVSNISGLPPGGTASYRMLDGAAVYVLPSATSIGSGVVCSLGLTGFTNTATAGTYTSTVTTYDNSATPVAVDSVTTSGLTFAAMANTSNTYVQVDPTFAVVIANQGSACNGESNFITSAGTATSINFGHLGAGVNASGGQALSVVSNAGGGFVVYVRGTQTTQNLRGSIRNWADTTGTYASPAALSGEAFGYTYKDSTTSSSVTNPASAKFAALTSTNQAVMGSTSSASGSSCVSFDAQSAAATPAGSYSATVVYTAVPTF